MWDSVTGRRLLAAALCVAGGALLGVSVYLSKVLDVVNFIPSLLAASVVLIALGLLVNWRTARRQVDRNATWEA